MVTLPSLTLGNTLGKVTISVIFYLFAECLSCHLEMFTFFKCLGLTLGKGAHFYKCLALTLGER
jgi:hypothetical protein